MSDTGDARILDRGHRRYEGRRTGVAGAVSSLTRHSLRSVLGLGRSARHKVFPVVAAMIAYIPAVVFAGLAALFDVDLLAEDALPSYNDYYGFVGPAIVLFTAFVTPAVLVGDRRNGMLSLYLSTPLDRASYLVAKTASVLLALAIVTLGPLLVLLIAYTFEGAGPGGIGDWLTVFAQIVASGAVLSSAYSAVSLAVSSLTDRRAFASVAVIAVLAGVSILVELVVDVGGANDQLHLLDVGSMPFELVQRVYDERGGFPHLDTWHVVLSNLAWTVAGGSVVWWRYRRLVGLR